jgi:predicted ATP-dependent endonuclease of OLD family
MRIKNVYIKNFRGISELNDPIELLGLNVFIGDNGTSKTAILEAINLCLSPGYAAARFDINDFHNGTDENIEITVEFDENFFAKLPDGFTTQVVECNKVTLIAKKRERATSGKAFSDLVTTTHYIVPLAPRGKDGWTQLRSKGTEFTFTERHLVFSSVDVDVPHTFYFSKSRNRQLAKGYGTSLTNIINDLNWRFQKGQRTATEKDHFKHVRKDLHEKIISSTDGETLKKTIDAANEILKTLEVSPVDISLLKTLTPYDHSEVVFSFDGFELPVEQGGSGIEMVTSLALLEAMAKISKDNIVLIIDEPELHLHPKLQTKLFEHLKEMCKEIQIVTSTHSPLLFKNLYQEKDVQLLVTKIEDSKVNIMDARASGFGVLKWSPSWGEICYFGYSLSTLEFHDDLYSSIEDLLKTSITQSVSQNDVENWFISKGQTKEIIWSDSAGRQREETLMTYIRNRIHHPDNTYRPAYKPYQLKDSIDRMIGFLRNP